MRWKLLIIASLLATLVGALPLLLGFYFGVLDRVPTTLSEALIKPNVRFLLALLLSVAAIIYATVFVYRHNARRRLLQAILTILFASAFTFAAIRFGFMFFNKAARPSESSLLTRNA